MALGLACGFGIQDAQILANEEQGHWKETPTPLIKTTIGLQLAGYWNRIGDAGYGRMVPIWRERSFVTSSKFTLSHCLTA